MIDLGDKRLGCRAVLPTERLGHKPGVSIPGACKDWAETAAAYRFLRNPQVGWDEVLAAHASTSRQRIGQHPVVLCLQTRSSWTITARPSRCWGRCRTGPSAGSTCIRPTWSRPSASRSG